MIEIKNLTKEFKSAVREEGVLGMFKTLFSTKYNVKTAVNNISLKISEMKFKREINGLPPLKII